LKTFNLIYTNLKSLSNFIEENRLSNYKNILVQIFTALDNKKDIKNLVKNILNILPASKIIGSTTDGEILGEQILLKKSVISFSVFEKTEVKTAFVSNSDSFKMGKKLTNKLYREDSKVLIAFADGLNSNGEDFIKGIESASSRLYVAGGLAGDYAKFKQTFVFNEKVISNNGAVGAILNSKHLIVNTDFNFSWKRVGKKCKITKSKKNIVYSIDNTDAFRVFDKYLGNDFLKSPLKDLLHFPFIIKRKGKDIARTVLGRGDDGSLIFGGNLKKNDKVQLGYGNIELILKNSIKLAKKVSKYPAESIFIYSCVARRRFMPHLIENEIKPFAKITDIAGFFTYGEFFHSKNSNEFLNESLTILALSESKKAINKIDNFKMDEHLSDYLKNLKSFSLLVENTTKELNQANSILNKERLELKKSKALISNVINATDDLIYYKGLDLKYLGSNRTFLELFRVEDVADSSDRDFFDIDICKRFKRLDSEIIEKRVSHQSLIWINLGKNSRYFSVKKAPLINKNNEVFGVVSVLRDVTKDYDIRTRFKEITDGIGEGLYVTDDVGICTFVNPSACEILGFTKKELVGKNIHNLIHYKSECEAELAIDDCPIFNKIKLGKKYFSTNDMFIRKDGKIIDISCTSTPLIEHKKIVGSITVFSDITNHKKTQELLVKSKVDEIELLKYRERYHSVQQQNAFDKQFKMIQDDFSNTCLDSLFIETFFKPLDVLSGDSYGTIDLGDGKILFYLIDAMGKGLSASVSSIQSVSFINHAIAVSLENGDFSFERLIRDYQHYIKRDLLDAELIAIMFMLYDNKKNRFYVANFGMPPLLVNYTTDEVKHIKANNPPIMSFFTNCNIDEYDANSIRKILLYSDGISENMTIYGRLYVNFLDNDFLHSKTKNELCSKVEAKMTSAKDDMTFILLKRLVEDLEVSKEFDCDSSEEGIDDMHLKIEDFLLMFDMSDIVFNKLSLAIHELLVNAYEHGNLEADFALKQDLVKENRYDKFLLDKAEIYKSKRINVKVSAYNTMYCRIIRVDIEDEGKGFDVSEFFKSLNFNQNHQEAKIRYTGRGVLMAKNLVDGLYYNKKGNVATIIQCLEVNS